MKISECVHQCLTAFEAVIAASDSFSPDIHKLHSDKFSDELGRFRIWRCNSSAHRTGRKSLEFRVRDDSEIRELVIKLLVDFEVLLRDTEASIRELSEEAEKQGDAASECKFMEGLVSETITQLFRVSMMVQVPPKSDFLRAQQLDGAFVALPSEFSHLRAEFPYAERSLITRLSKSNIRRRNYLTYRSRRRADAAQEVEEAVDFDGGKTETDTMSNSNQGLLPKPLPSQIAFSETSFAASLMGGTHEGMPKRPRTGDIDEEFECPYCFSIITAPSPKVWVKHIFTDLMPYICHLDSCKMADVLYDSRHHWFWHIETCHKAEIQHDINTNGGVTCPLCLNVYKLEAWPAHVGRHLQHVSLFALPKIDSDPEEPWWPFPPRLEGYDSDDSSPGNDQTYGVSEEKSRAIVFTSDRLHNNRYKPFIEQDDLRLRIIREGTDWDALSNFIRRTRDFARNWYQKEIRKWGYGYQLHLAAEQANKEYGREREQFREGRLAFPCLVPDCLADYDTLRELEDHMETHCQGNWKHWDLYYLDLRSGRAYQSFKYCEVFLEDNFQGTLPPRYPPPLPPGQTPSEPSPSEKHSEPEDPFVPDCLPVDEMLENQGLCRSDILPTMLFRFEHYYEVMANDYCRGLPEDPEARNRNFKYLVDLTLPQVAKKAKDVEQWKFADFEEIRTKLIKDVQSLRRRLNAYESENMDGTLRPMHLSEIQPDTEETGKDTIERQATEGNDDEQRVLAIYVSAENQGSSQVHATERIPRDDAPCRLDRALVSRYDMFRSDDPKIRDNDIFIDLPRYLSWHDLKRSLKRTVRWKTNAENLGYDRGAIECVQQINLDPETWIAALYYDVKPPGQAVRLDTSDRDRRHIGLEQSMPATSASEAQE